jgi:hypothetical protein
MTDEELLPELYTELAERVEELFHLRKLYRSRGTLTLTTTATNNTAVGSCDHSADIFHGIHAMCAKIYTDTAIGAELLINGRIPRYLLTRDAHACLQYWFSSART